MLTGLFGHVLIVRITCVLNTSCLMQTTKFKNETVAYCGDDGCQCFLSNLYIYTVVDKTVLINALTSIVMILLIIAIAVSSVQRYVHLSYWMPV